MTGEAPPDTTPQPPSWRPTRNTKIVVVLAVIALWTVFAGQWADKGCDLMPQSYSLVIGHGSPDRWQGCADEPDGPVYTDDYLG